MLTIGALSNRSGTSRDTIRFYERIGLLAPEGSTSSGYKLYGDRSLQRVACIRLAQRCGFSLQEICTLLQPCTPNSKTSEAILCLAAAKKQEIDETLDMLRKMSAALSRMLGEHPAQWGIDAENALVSAIDGPPDPRETLRSRPAAHRT